MACRTRTIDGRRRGFTLAESLIASATMALAVAGIAGPILSSYRQTTVAAQLTQGAQLARELLEEIGSRPFVDPVDGSTTLGPESGESKRSKYDNLDDFDGYQDMTTSLKTLDNQDLGWNGSWKYKRSVKAEYRATPAGSAVSSGNYLMVTVTVETPSGQSVSVQRLFCRYPRGN